MDQEEEEEMNIPSTKIAAIFAGAALLYICIRLPDVSQNSPLADSETLRNILIAIVSIIGARTGKSVVQQKMNGKKKGDTS